MSTRDALAVRIVAAFDIADRDLAGLAALIGAARADGEIAAPVLGDEAAAGANTRDAVEAVAARGVAVVQEVRLTRAARHVHVGCRNAIRSAPRLATSSDIAELPLFADAGYLPVDSRGILLYASA